MRILDKIKTIFAKEKAMQLDKTVDMMLSDDYIDRFKAEYHQLVNRANKLRKHIKTWNDKTKGCTSEGDLSGEFMLLKWQLRTMDDYIYILKIRAEVEGIYLK